MVQLTNALACVLNDPEKINELCAIGKAFVMTNYCWDVIEKEIEKHMS